MANDSKNMLRVKEVMVFECIPYKSAIFGSPGAIMELPSGGINVYRAIWKIKYSQFRLKHSLSAF